MNIPFGEGPSYTFTWPLDPADAPKKHAIHNLAAKDRILDDERIVLTCQKFTRKQRDEWMRLHRASWEVVGSKNVGTGADPSKIVRFKISTSVTAWSGVKKDGEAVDFDANLLLDMIQLLNGGLDRAKYGSFEDDFIAEIDRRNNLGEPSRDEDDSEKNP